jgi:hypothetical protein
MRPITVPCSNCMTPLTLRPDAMTIEFRRPASGRGWKRVEARAVLSYVTFDGALYLWDAPCCPDYADSLEESP